MTQNAIGRWSQFFIDKYKTTLLVVLAIIVAGTWGALNNQRQDFPSIPSNFITVQATYIGASAADVEQQVLIPLEQSLSSLNGVDTVRATAGDNFGNLVIEMENVDGTEAAAKAAEELVSQADLPADVDTDVDILDLIGPSFVYALSSDTVDTATLLDYAGTINTRLSSASNDVSRIAITPNNEFQVVVELDQTALAKKQLSGQAVTQAVQSYVLSLPAGNIETITGQRLAITVAPAAGSLDELQDLRVHGVRLADVADITRQPKDLEQLTLAGYIENGTPVSRDSIYLFVYKKDNGDIIQISDDLRGAETSITADQVLPDDIQLVKVFDNSTYVASQINSLLYNGAIGLVLILLVLMLFINLRTGIVVAAIIPLAFFGTLAVLYVLGFSINILTLFGLLLVLGILVDNAIVIAEGIVHGIEMGQTKLESIQNTMRHLGPAVTAATLTTIVVFIPFASIGGIVGAFLKFIPYTIIIMLVMSYFLAITITPVLSWFFLKEETKEIRQARGLKLWQKLTVLPAVIYYAQKLIDWLQQMYGNFAQVIFRNRWKRIVLVVGTLLLISISIGGFASRLESKQFPDNDANSIAITFDFPTTLGFADKQAAVTQVMEQAITIPFFQSYYFYDGQAIMILDDPATRPDGNSIDLLLENLNGRVAAVADALAKQEIAFSASSVGAGPPKAEWDVEVELRGTDYTQLQAAADDLTAYLDQRSDVPETENELRVSTVDSVAVTLDNSKLHATGIDPSMANQSVRSIFAEQTVGHMTVGATETSSDVVVRYSHDSTDSIEDLNSVLVGIKNGLPVTLQEVADVERVSGLERINRLNDKRVAAVRAKVTDTSDAAVVEQEIKDYLTAEHLDQYDLATTDVVYGGFSAAINDNYDSLVLVFILAMIAVYIILVYQFNSFVQPGLIMFTIPMALIGVFPALFVIDSSLDMISGLGIIALVGIVVNDAIVFIDYYNRLRLKHADWPLSDLLIKTGVARFKPILSTSITTIFGVLPLTLTDPFWQGLGTSLVAGLICSTLGTLIVFPVLILWSEGVLGWLRALAVRCRIIKT